MSVQNLPVKSFSLYQLANEYQEAYNDLVCNFDIPDEAITDTLEALQGDVKSKSIQVGMFFRNLDAFIGAAEEAEKQMRDRIRIMKNKREKIKAYLKENMERCGITSITDSPYFVIKIQDCPQSVQIIDEKAIPKEYLREKHSVEPDKVAILRALKNGENIGGVSLIKNKTLIIK